MPAVSRFRRAPSAAARRRPLWPITSLDVRQSGAGLSRGCSRASRRARCSHLALARGGARYWFGSGLGYHTRLDLPRQRLCVPRGGAHPIYQCHGNRCSNVMARLRTRCSRARASSCAGRVAPPDVVPRKLRRDPRVPRSGWPILHAVAVPRCAQRREVPTSSCCAKCAIFPWFSHPFKLDLAGRVRCRELPASAPERRRSRRPKACTDLGALRARGARRQAAGTSRIWLC